MGVWKGPPGSRNDRGGKKGLVQPPRMLVLMRRVLEQKEEQDKSEGEHQCRRMLKESPTEFMREINDLEKRHLDNKAKRKIAEARKQPQEAPRQERTSEAPVQAQADPGTVRVTELINRLLGEWEASVGTAGAAR